MTSMVNGSTGAPPDDKGITNPLTTALQTGTKDRSDSSARRFMTALPSGALVATLIVSLRILTVAHLNLSIALQLVTLTDTTKVLLGLAVILFEPLIICVALYVHLACTETLGEIITCARSKRPINVSNRSL